MLVSMMLVAASLIHSGDRVVLMGDSQAFLLGWEFPPLAEADGVTFTTVSMPGSSVISWSKGGRWPDIHRARPSVLLVALGSNDACMGVRVVANERPFLKRFLRRVRAVKAREVVWLSPPKIGTPQILPQANSGQDAFASLLASENVNFLDARAIEVPLWNDRLHCSRPQFYGDSANGCQKWAGWVWERVTRSP